MSLETHFVWQRGAILLTAIRTKELREHCHFPLPTLFYVFLQKGCCELQQKWGLGKKGLGGRLQMETLQRPSQLRMPSTYCTLCKCDFLVKSAGIPCKDMHAIQLHVVGSDRKHSLLNCYFFLLGTLNKYKRLNYQQLKLSLW